MRRFSRLTRLLVLTAFAGAAACGGPSAVAPTPTNAAVAPTPTPALTPTPAPAPDPDPTPFRIAIVDGTATPAAQSDVLRVFDVAKGLMLQKTGVTMTIVDYSQPGAGSASGLASAYIAAHAESPPDGVLLLLADATAASLGGYSFTSPLPTGLVNRHPSPFAGSNRAYVAVVHFDHMYARCGYDNALNHVSETSFGGECRNTTGLKCVHNGRYWTCPNATADFYAQPDIFPASTFVHEFAHPFGPAGNNDHYGTATCTARTGMSAADAASRVLFQQSFGMCPDVYLNFRR